MRRKQKNERQGHELVQRCWREKEANPEDCDNKRGNRQEEGADVKEESAKGSW